MHVDINQYNKPDTGQRKIIAYITGKQNFAPYIPGLLLFLIALIISLLTYKNYGMSWDETTMRDLGLMTYNYITKGSQDLINSPTRCYGQAFEVPLIFIEKNLGLTDSRDIYLMRHLVTNILFLVSALSFYILAYKIFKSRFIASLAFLMLVCAPRLYAHSFFNSRDMPFLSMFVITMCFAQIAFEKNRKILYLILGTICGCTTAIRIMGVMLGAFILLFLLFDLISQLKYRKSTINASLKLVLFILGFCIGVYTTWPYLWHNPVHNFVESFASFSRYAWEGDVLLNGSIQHSTHLSWNYFPTWFLITNPELWLFSGIAGIIFIAFAFIRRPFSFLKNTAKRNFLLYIMCFFAPIAAVLYLNSVIYDDWRHLYFLYPSFIMMALYFISKLLQTKFRLFVKTICVLQVVIVLLFMVVNFPFNQVYFNSLVSHKQEYLRKNYELDYWGSSLMQGLEHLLETDVSDSIKVGSYNEFLVTNNIAMLPKAKRNRIVLTDLGKADYMITNYRGHPDDFNIGKEVYAIHVLNSRILSIFRLDKKAAVK